MEGKANETLSTQGEGISFYSWPWALGLDAAADRERRMDGALIPCFSQGQAGERRGKMFGFDGIHSTYEKRL